MNFNEVKEKFEGQYKEIEAYKYSGLNHSINTDTVDGIDLLDVDGCEKVLDYYLMNEDDYNNTLLANSCITADFADWYGDNNAKILVVVIEPLTAEQSKLKEHLEAKGYKVTLFEQGGEICAEVVNWTDRGVNMVVTLLPFTFEELSAYVEDFDVDEEIDIHRQDERYRNAFRISQSVKDFEDWHEEITEAVDSFGE